MTTLILVLVLLILLSAFFSSAETGMMASNRYRLQHLADQGNRSATLALKLLKNPDRLLGIILIGNTFANILASAIATTIAVHYWGQSGIALATIILTLVVLIFAEVAPKTMAAHYPDRYARIAVWPLASLLTLLLPVVILVNGCANILLRIVQFKAASAQTQAALSDDELRTVVDTSSSQLPDSHKEMLLGVFDLKKSSVLDIMIPRNEINGIDLTNDIDTITRQITATEHMRLPVYENNLDHLKGVLHLRKAIHLLKNTAFDKSELLHVIDPPYFVPENATLNQQLLRFQQRKCRLAFVVDEYGEVQGLVTLDDILEEIVGEFTTDNTDTSNAIHPQNDGSYLLDGAITLHELNRALDVKLSTDGPKTLNGLILEHLETLPKAGASLQIDRCAIEIIDINDNRVKTARIRVD